METNREDTDNDNFWDDHDGHLNFVSIAPPVARDMERELAHFGIWDQTASGYRLGWGSGVDPEAADDDATLTNTAREARECLLTVCYCLPYYVEHNTVLEELEGDDDLARDLGIEVDRNGDWWPYPNKTVSYLLYFQYIY